MTPDTPPEFALEAARKRGLPPRGWWRVVVLESNGELRVSDYGGLDAAKQYANDVASESDDPTPLAYVFDDKLQFVCRGRHYAAS